jgi:3-oxoacyl-[acyl-carrier-protein] synthase II
MAGKRRVVVTGRGVVSCLGNSPAGLHQALCERRSGLTRVEGFPTAGLTWPVAGEIRNFDPKAYVGKKNMRPLDRTARFVVTAAHLALEDSGWTAEARAAHEVGLVLGTLYGSVRTIAEFDRRAVEAGPGYVSPLDFANTVINAAAGQTAIWHDLRGINSTIATGQTSGLRAVAYAADLIASGRADVLLAGGAEELCLESFLSLERAGFVSLDKDREPVPFGAARSGFLPGEGCGLLVLESAANAARRGARALAEIRGSGIGFDPTRNQDPGRSQEATAGAVRGALATAEIAAEEIGAVSASANGGPLDDVEARTLEAVLGARAAAVPRTAIKASLGDTLGADGGLQAVVAVETLRKGAQPGIRGADGPSPHPIAAPSVLLTSLGWDGQRCALLIATARES